MTRQFLYVHGSTVKTAMPVTTTARCTAASRGSGRSSATRGAATSAEGRTSVANPRSTPATMVLDHRRCRTATQAAVSTRSAHRISFMSTAE